MGRDRGMSEVEAGLARRGGSGERTLLDEVGWFGCVCERSEKERTVRLGGRTGEVGRVKCVKKTVRDEQYSSTSYCLACRRFF